MIYGMNITVINYYIDEMGEWRERVSFWNERVNYVLYLAKGVEISAEFSGHETCER